jgi:hypothetical protein
VLAKSLRPELQESSKADDTIDAYFREEWAPRVLSGTTRGAPGVLAGQTRHFPGRLNTDSETVHDLGFEGSSCFKGLEATSARIKCRKDAISGRLENAARAIA